MKQVMPQQSASFATLFDPALALEAAERAARWDLPRRVCRPLDRYVGPRANIDQAAFDAEVELAPAAEEPLCDEPQSSCGRREIIEPDFEDDGDF